jgi:hypothetical protein
MLIEASGQIASRITGAIRSAAQATGASFEYLLKTAQRESNFNPGAKASTSSAAGLFQFIEQTWLQTMKAAGPALGYEQQADGIVRTASGRFVVPDAAQRKEIMRLRTDPEAASAMAGAFTRHNAAYLSERLGRQPTDGELYIAHFLGPAGAVQLISAAADKPNAKAADLFPRAARANRPIFYQRGGARSAAQVYDVLVAKHQNTRMPLPLTPTAVAQRGRNAPAPLAGVSTAVPAVAPVSAYAGETGPVFHNLFRTGRDTPVSQVVTELWNSKGAQAPDASAARAVKPAAAVPAGRPLELFRFLRPDIRAQGNRPA